MNLGVTNGVTISQLPTPPSGAPVPRLGHLTGTIQSLIASGFTLQTRDGRTFTIDVNSSTTYNYPSSVCSADNSTCLATQQVVKVEVSLQAGGTLLASEVDYVQPAGQTIVEGNIIRLSTSGGNTLMDLILQKGPTAPSTLPMGHRVTVTVPASATYAIDSGSFTLPISPPWAKLCQRLGPDRGSGSVGRRPGIRNHWRADQAVRPPGLVLPRSLSPPVVLRLNPARSPVRWQRSMRAQLSFTLSTLPNFFVPPAATAGAPPIWVPVNITVQTTGATTFCLRLSPRTAFRGWL